MSYLVSYIFLGHSIRIESDISGFRFPKTINFSMSYLVSSLYSANKRNIWVSLPTFLAKCLIALFRACVFDES